MVWVLSFHNAVEKVNGMWLLPLKSLSSPEGKYVVMKNLRVSHQSFQTSYRGRQLILRSDQKPLINILSTGVGNSSTARVAWLCSTLQILFQGKV